MAIQKYRIKPRTVRAVQWTGDLGPINELLGDDFVASNTWNYCLNVWNSRNRLDIVVRHGFWLVKEADKIEAISDEAFRAEYEPIQRIDTPRPPYGPEWR